MGLIKKSVLVCLFAILGPSFCFASATIGVNSFSGLDSQDPPNALQPNQSQDLLNVRLQPGGRSVHKRDGYGLFQTINAVSTATVHGGYHFQQTGGADVQLWGSDSGLFASINDATFVKVATGTVGATWQCTDNLGFAYCVTSSGVDSLVKTDGSVANTTYHPEVPVGTAITSTPLQLVIIGVSGNQSTINVSANNNFLNFTPGPLPTDSYQEIINSPGSRLTHIGYYFGNIYWWKDQSFGYVSGSASQGTVGIVIVSNQIGTLDDSSAFWNPTSYDTGNQFSTGAGPTSTGNPYFNEMQQLGGIFFRGQDNHIYQYDGYNLTRISRIITPNVTASGRRKLNFLTQTPFSYTENFSSTATYTTDLAGWSVSGSSFVTIIPTGSEMHLTNPILGDIPNSFVIHVAFDFTTIPNSGSNVGIALINSSGNGYGIEENPMGNLSWGQKISGIYGVAGGFISNGFSDTATHTMDLLYSATGYMQAYFDGVLKGSLQDSSFSGMNHPSLFGAGNGQFLEITSFYVTSSTNTFYANVENAPLLSSWGALTENDTTNGGSITYYSRASTNSFSVLSSTPSWVPQPKNSIVAASTGTYYQLRADFVSTATLNNFTFNWTEGNASDKAYIQYFQDAILFSVSSGSSTSTNNTIFYLDLLNSTWLKDNIAANGFAVENNTLYIGDPLSASVYKFGGVTTDQGNPIQSYWKSMDFTGQDPTVKNDWNQADFAFGESSNTVTFTYLIDQSSATTFADPISLYSPSSSILKRGFTLDRSGIGTYFNFSIGDNSSLSPWTLMGERTTYIPLPWRPQTSN